MNKVNYDKKLFDVDAYGNLIPKGKDNSITHGTYIKKYGKHGPITVKKLRKSPQPSGKTCVKNFVIQG
jgi:hypothetical protein